ncbi:MAG: tryptophan synthase subunit alpha [Verrucomicrobia bacterium]|nr:MAG: tryptophan synthase subunit alpha [Verrucomicrobiota bacterium]
MKKISELFQREKAHVAYLTAGDGGVERTIEAALALIEGGVNLLELGVPFSDPIADGPVIQQASLRALQAGITMYEVLYVAHEIRKKSTIPIILFSYYNPILAALDQFQGNFLAEAKRAGVDGFLIVDLPWEESHLLQARMVFDDLTLISVITPSTSLERIIAIDQKSQGFLYYVCRAGTTGAKTSLPIDFSKKIKKIKSVVHLPVVVGFGISDEVTVQRVLQYANGVVIGSFFVQAVAQGLNTQALKIIAQQLLGRRS